MIKLVYRGAAAITSAAIAIGFAAPVGATGTPSNYYNNHNHHHHQKDHGQPNSSKTTNIDSNNTTDITTTNTTTTTTSSNKTSTFNNSGIIQTQSPAGQGHKHGGSSGGTQTAVQGNSSGVYKVSIDQGQATSQSNETSNEAVGQENNTQNYNGSLLSKNQTSTQTNSNSQTLTQSNSTSQSMDVSQSAQGVVVN